jgi:hypothetical protein
MSSRFRTVLINDLPVGFNVESLHKALKVHGSVQYLLTPTADSAYVVFDNVDSADRCSDLLDGTQFQGSTLTVRICPVDRSRELDSLIAQQAKLPTGPQLSEEVSHICDQLANLPFESINSIFEVLKTRFQAQDQKLQNAASASRNQVPSTPLISTQSPLGSPSQPACSAQSTQSFPVNTSLYQAPKVSFFSGESHKGDVSFEIWKAEVISLRSAGYSSASIMYAIRRSIKGRAADLVLSMGIHATLDMVLDKFQRIFGTVSTPELLLEQYYSSRQLPNETVAEWACRLEEILHKLEERGCPVVGQSISMLRSKFWSGLRDINVKNALRHMYDSHVPYVDLLVAARRAEHEARSMTAFSSQINAETTSYQKLLDEI